MQIGDTIKSSFEIISGGRVKECDVLTLWKTEQQDKTRWKRNVERRLCNMTERWPGVKSTRDVFFRRGVRMNIRLEVFSLVALSVTNDHDRQGLSFCSADAPLYFVTGSVSFCTPLSIQLRLCHHLLYVGIVPPYVLLFNLFVKYLLCTRHR